MFTVFSLNVTLGIHVLNMCKYFYCVLDSSGPIIVVSVLIVKFIGMIQWEEPTLYKKDSKQSREGILCISEC